MSKSRKKYAIKNILYNFISKIVMLILAFIARTVFIWGFGTEYLGINGLFTDVLNLLSMADLGFGIAMVYSFYQPLANNDEEKISGLITFYRKAYIIIAATVSIIGVTIVPILPYIINLDNTIPGITLYYLLSLANVVSSYICVYKTSILTADQKNYVVVRISLVTSIIKMTLQIISIILFKNYVVFLIIGICITLFNNVYTSRIAEKQYPYIKNRTDISKQEKMGIYKNLGSVFLFKVTNVLMNATDNILISVVLGTVVVGYYSNYLLIQTNIIAFYSLLFTSITASVGNLIATESAEKRYQIFNMEQSIGFIMGCIIVPCYVVLINDFIEVWLGSKYIFDCIVVIAIGINTYLSCVLQPLWTFREATGLYRKTKWVMVICSGINIVLSYVLGKLIGISGIIFASAISRLVTYIWYEPMLLFNQYFNRGVKKYYVSMVTNLFFVVGICVVNYYLASMIQVERIWGWICEAFVVFVISLIASFVLYRNNSGIKMVMDSLFRRKSSS